MEVNILDNTIKFMVESQVRAFTAVIEEKNIVIKQLQTLVEDQQYEIKNLEAQLTKKDTVTDGSLNIKEIVKE